MPLPSDFCAFILTHGRPDRVLTVDSLRRAGYTGRIVIVIDNEDKTADEYRKRFGDAVQVFDKKAVAARIDEGDNFQDRRAIIYARNACFDIARKLGIRTFIQLDDDYFQWNHKRSASSEYIERPIKDLDAVILAMLEYFEAAPFTALAMAQNGDFIGGALGTAWRKPLRKAMNSFVCSTDRPFEFFGRINEDVNTYTNAASRGALFLTLTAVALQQKATQANAGGMTELYLSSGTYVKSFYSVMYQPSSVVVYVMPTDNPRLHHLIRWRDTVPMILSEQHRKPQV